MAGVARFLLRQRLLRPLRHRSFALLWSGQTLSSVGNAATEIALAWLVYGLTGSALEMGTILALFNLPMLVFLLMGGVVADRLPRRTIMLASDAVRCLMAATIAALVFSQHLQLWHLQGLALATGTAVAFFYPAQSSVVPDLVPEADLLSANSLNSGSMWIAEVVGPVLGATLVAWAGMPAAFAFDAATFAVSAVCLLLLPAIPVVSPEVRESSVVREVMEGFRTVLGSTWLWFTIAIFSLIVALYDSVYTVVLPKLVLERLGGQVEALGLLRGALGAGLVAGMVVIGQRGMPEKRGIWLYGATAAAGLGLAGVGITGDLLVAMALMALGGAMWSAVETIWETSIQELIPQHLRGRVRSIDFLGSYSLIPLAMLGAGAAAEAVGAAPLFLIAGSLSALLALTALLVPGIRRFGAEG